MPQDKHAPEHNGYGFVTDSVNPNPAAFVTRSSSICGLPTKSMLAGCTELEAVFKSTTPTTTHHRTYQRNKSKRNKCSADQMHSSFSCLTFALSSM